MEGLTELEQAVLDRLLAGHHSALDALREQAKRSRLRHREYTGVGFWTWFAVPDDAPAASPSEFMLSGVNATLAGLKHGAGFWLFVRNGYLDQLEGFTYDEPWPADATTFELIDTRFHFGDRPPPVVGQLVVSVGEVRSKRALLQAIADGLLFPDWFGWNWDALEDCLRDLTWLPHQEVVIYHHAMPALTARDLSIYLDILSEAVRFSEVERFRDGSRAPKFTVTFVRALGPRLGRWDTVTIR